MINVIRRRQIVGLIIIEDEEMTPFDRVKEVWSDATRRVNYLACTQGYARLQQVSDVTPDTVFTYDRWLLEAPNNIYCLYRLAVDSPAGNTLGWIDDFLFDWQTGEIIAYIVAGVMAATFGERAVLLAEDVEAIDEGAILLKEGALNRLKSESEGLKGFLCEKSPQVRKLVKRISDRLDYLIYPNDKPEVIRHKIKTVRDELASDRHCDCNALAEAAIFVQQHWENIQPSLTQRKEWAKSSLETAWQEIIGK